MKDITTNYDPTVLPFNPVPGQNRSQTKVEIQFQIYGVNYIDLITGTASFQASLQQQWNDTSVAWDKNDFGGVDKVWMRSDTGVNTLFGWTPDLTIRENAGEGKLSNLLMTDYQISHNGSVYWSATGEVIVRFSPVINKYPMDTQNILFTFELWSYSDDDVMLVLHNDPFLVQDPDFFIEYNIAWDFVDYDYKEEWVAYKGSNYTTCTFSVSL